jgi:hypothetical protein
VRPFESFKDAVAKRHAATLTRRLRALLQLAMREDAADVDDALGSVDVAALKRDPLLGPKAGSDREEGNGVEPRVELLGDCLQLGPVGKGLYLGRLRLRVNDVAGR